MPDCMALAIWVSTSLNRLTSSPSLLRITSRSSSQLDTPKSIRAKCLAVSVGLSPAPGTASDHQPRSQTRLVEGDL